MKEIVRTNYSFNFCWLGRPVIQIPQDLFAMQEIIWGIKPDVIIELYTPFVSVGSYCAVFDTGIEDLRQEMIINRPWGPGNNPQTAVWEFLTTNDAFEIDNDIETKPLNILHFHNVQIG
jgi:cephalosporin hydroxylase